MIKDKKYLLNISDKILNKAKKLGATETSVVVSNSVSEDINYRNKKIDGSTRSENLGAKLTTYFGKKKSQEYFYNSKPKKLLNDFSKKT